MAVSSDCPNTYNLRFVRGAMHLVVGPSGCGKTFRTCDILRYKDKIIQGGDEIKNVVFCYSAWQPIYDNLWDTGVVTKFFQKNPTSEDFVKLVEGYRDMFLS